jgi:hypothetical protein
VFASGLLKGQDKGSFYNERFIQGLPFLAKKMKRIGGAKIVEDINISHEPILWKISAERPIPAGLSKDSWDYIVLDTINKCIQEGGPKSKIPFVHNMKTVTYAKKDAREVALKAPAPRTDLSTSQGGMLNDFSLTPARSASVTTSNIPSCHEQVSSIQEGLNNTHMEALLQQHQRMLHDHQGYAGQLDQQTHMQQPLSQDQNQQANMLLLKLMLNERNQAATTLAPQQHQAWLQHQLQTAIPAANTVNTISDAGRFPNAHIPTSPAPFAELPSLQGNISNSSSIASLLGLHQIGNNVSAPLASAIGNIKDTLIWLYLLQANQIQGQQQATPNPGIVLNSVLQNVLQSQLQQAMRPTMFQLYPHHQTTFSQNTYSPSSQQPYSVADALANIISQSQPAQYNQQPQPYRLELYSLPQQHLMTHPSQQQHQQLQQHDGQDQYPNQPQDEGENQKGHKMSD